MDDVRYYVMSSVRENLARVMGRSRGVGPVVSWLTPPQTGDAAVPCPQAVLPVYQSNVFTLMSNISVPRQESAVCSFMVTQAGKRLSCEEPRLSAAPLRTGLCLAARQADWKAAKLKVSLLLGSAAASAAAPADGLLLSAGAPAPLPEDVAGLPQVQGRCVRVGVRRVSFWRGHRCDPCPRPASSQTSVIPSHLCILVA